MANRRMFSADVVCTDKFLEMPASSQALYLQLGMKADDDGFVSAPKQITRMTNASEDDFRILISKGYIIPFDSGVIVIKEWRVNNYLRKDRYTETRHLKEKSALEIVNDVYVISGKLNSVSASGVPYGIPDGNRSVSQVDTQVRIGKVNNNICSSRPDERESDFKKIYEIYPRKDGETKAFANYCSWLKGRIVNGKRRKLTNREMYIAVHRYVEKKKAEGVELKFYNKFDNLMGDMLLDYVEDPEDE